MISFLKRLFEPKYKKTWREENERREKPKPWPGKFPHPKDDAKKLRKAKAHRDEQAKAIRDAREGAELAAMQAISNPDIAHEVGRIVSSLTGHTGPTLTYTRKDFFDWLEDQGFRRSIQGDFWNHSEIHLRISGETLCSKLDRDLYQFSNELANQASKHSYSFTNFHDWLIEKGK